MPTKRLYKQPLQIASRHLLEPYMWTTLFYQHRICTYDLWERIMHSLSTGTAVEEMRPEKGWQTGWSDQGKWLGDSEMLTEEQKGQVLRVPGPELRRGAVGSQRPGAGTHLEHLKHRETVEVRDGGGGHRDHHVLPCETLWGLWLLLGVSWGHWRLSR